MAQSATAPPQLQPSYINHFAEEESAYSNKCLNDLVLDRDGRLWVNVCGQDRVINSIGLFQFDGYRFDPVELTTKMGQVVKSPALRGQVADGRLLGASWRSCFLLDPDSRELSFLPFADTTHRNLSFNGFSTANGELYVMGHTKNKNIQLFREEKGKLVKELELEYDSGTWGTKNYPLLTDDREYWLMGGTFPLYRHDRTTGYTRKYTLADLITNEPIAPPTISILADQFPVLHKKGDGTIYLYLPDYYDNRFLVFDRQADRFVSLRDQFPADWKPQHLFTDAVGNICFLFRDGAGGYRAMVHDMEGQRWEYTAVVESIPDIRQLVADDFRRQVYVVGAAGLYSIGVREEEPIRKAMSGEWISAMARLPDGHLLVNTVKNGWFVYDEQQRRASRFVGPDCGLPPNLFAKGMKQQVVPDSTGHLWMIARQYLLRYHPLTQTCEAYDLGRPARLFAFVNEQLVAIQFGQDTLRFYDLTTQRFVDFGPNIPQVLSGFIRDLYVDTQGRLWVPTNDGLWHFDLDQRTHRRYGVADGFSDYRFTSIYEQEPDVFFLGTYYGGLHRFATETGRIDIIDQRKGLSNSAVMSIVSDEQGDLWVSTEYGINVVAPSGEVRYRLYEEDGLSHNIFERFDPFRAADGRLFFGSQNGISIIDPARVKAGMRDKNSLQIYLTELSYFAPEADQEVTLRKALSSLSPVRIPAGHPNIQLKFGVSSYLEPHKNSYAYKIEAWDDDWHYIGAQPTLTLTNLPAGRYDILIKGADFRNNWTEKPLRIPIHAQAFFYQRVWFPLVVASPFLVIGIVWLQYKQREARRLEREVARRTQQIEADKQVITRQADELKQLDEFKTRFFTNISHELRTPLTLIKTPLEDILQKPSMALGQRVTDSLRLVFRNTLKLDKLVAELLELAKLDARRAMVYEVPVPLTLFCQQLFHTFSSASEIRGITYRYRSDLDGNAYFLIDPNRLEKIINNLLSNALKFTPPGGRVDLRLFQSDNHLFIEVQDDGLGIAEEDLPHVFDRFYQAQQNSQTVLGGTGIGLALSKELASLMQGELTVVSQAGQGALFRLCLPSRPVGADQSEHAMVVSDPWLPGPVEQAELPIRAGVFPQAKILVVEDNPDMQFLIQSILDDQYDCHLAANGAVAWQWLTDNDPEEQGIALIIMDVMMPEMDGYTLLQKIKAHPNWQQLPVIMLTARALEEDKLKALRLGVDDYLLKPFSTNELIARVTNLVQNYQSRQQALREQQKPGIVVAFAEETAIDQEWLQRLENATQKALEQRVKLNAPFLAKQMYLSERQLTRKIKTYTGLTTSGYIQEVKLQKARHLLEAKVFATVNEVATACGYGSGSYLTKVYQERFGVMPSDYMIR